MDGRLHVEGTVLLRRWHKSLYFVSVDVVFHDSKHLDPVFTSYDWPTVLNATFLCAIPINIQNLRGGRIDGFYLESIAKDRRKTHSFEEVRLLMTKGTSVSDFPFSSRREALCSHGRRNLNWLIDSMSRRVGNCMTHTHSRLKALLFVRWYMTSSKFGPRSQHLSTSYPSHSYGSSFH